MTGSVNDAVARIAVGLFPHYMALRSSTYLWRQKFSEETTMTLPLLFGILGSRNSQDAYVKILLVKFVPDDISKLKMEEALSLIHI